MTIFQIKTDYIKAATFPDDSKWFFSFSHIEKNGMESKSKAEYASEKEAVSALIKTICAIYPCKRVFINTRGNSAAWGLNVPENVTIKQGI